MLQIPLDMVRRKASGERKVLQGQARCEAPAYRENLPGARPKKTAIPSIYRTMWTWILMLAGVVPWFA